jgi:uncharacterized Tic20 family protein
METSVHNITATQRTLGAATHLGALAQYVFPFGNFVLSIVIWSSARQDSEFVDREGKSLINFQLSIFLYSLLMALVFVPLSLATVFSNWPVRSIRLSNLSFTDIWASDSGTSIAILLIIAFLFCLMKIAEFFLVILGAVQAGRGNPYKYPFTINFIK